MGLGADIICKPADAVAVSETIFHSLKVGGEAILICAGSKHRYGMDIFKEELEKIKGLQVSCQSVTEMEDEHLFLNGNVEDSGLELTSGYVEGMNLIFFRVKKIITNIDA